MNNYYDLLGISKTANLQEIKAAYKKQALKFHPDRNAHRFRTEEEAKIAEDAFKIINEAYQVLSDPFKKNRYDNQLEFENTKKTHYYKEHTSSGNYSDYQSNTNSTGQGYTYQRKTTPPPTTFEFGKTQLYIFLGFAIITAFGMLLYNVMTNYSYSTYIKQAEAAIEVKDFSTAKRALEEAKTQKEKDAQVNYLLGKIQIEQKKGYEEAITYFDNAISYVDAEDTENKAIYYTAKAQTYFLMNEYYKAIEEYKKTNALLGYKQEIVFEIASLYLDKLKDYDKASLYFDKIIEKQPQLVDAYIGKAAAKLHAKDYEAMGELLDKAIKINPENPFLWYYNGFYLWQKPIKEVENKEEIQLKNQENACESWRKAVKYGDVDANQPLKEYCK